ncbi:MAG: membrane protein [Rhodobacter sp. CACIA14H1]|nr:MAG: membrane protein [Rhodobacter sp. CACIA14H1]
MIAEELMRLPLVPLPILALRLIGAVVLCGLIGVEREAQRQAAGLRTHILVGLAACLYALITTEIVAGAEGELTRVDPLRIVEAVTGGVAFLAAGMIVFHNGQVRGLTTGAGMWLAAAVGLCTGLGLWVMAVAATALSLVVMALLPSRHGRAGTGGGDGRLGLHQPQREKDDAG